MAEPIKVPLPAFLKMLTSNNVPATKAMAIAGKLYKSCNTTAALAELTDFKLQDIGITSAEERKLVLNAVRKAGYKATSPTKQTMSARRNPPTNTVAEVETSKTCPSDLPGPSRHVDAGKAKRKRKRDDERNEFLPDRPSEELEEQTYGSLEFNEVLDEEVLQHKHAVVNRAPIMTAWSCIVAERLGFSREEALSIASVYTEMNAVSNGITIGIYSESKKNSLEASQGGSQPYVDLMGRRPLFQTANESWRALSSGTPVSPASAFSYITRSLRQTAPFIVGALRLLADTYTPDELNKHGFSLYAEFRPEVKEWGGRGEVRCERILCLKKGASAGLKLSPNKAQQSGGALGDTITNTAGAIEFEAEDDKIEGSSARKGTEGDIEGMPDQKKPRTISLEEYEAVLDEDETFADVNLDFPD